MFGQLLHRTKGIAAQTNNLRIREKHGLGVDFSRGLVNGQDRAHSNAWWTTTYTDTWPPCIERTLYLLIDWTLL